MLYFCLVKFLITKSISRWHVINNCISLFLFVDYKTVMGCYVNVFWETINNYKFYLRSLLFSFVSICIKPVLWPAKPVRKGKKKNNPKLNSTILTINNFVDTIQEFHRLKIKSQSFFSFQNIAS